MSVGRISPREATHENSPSLLLTGEQQRAGHSGQALFGRQLLHDRRAPIAIMLSRH
jgi:hypothetical protein